MLMLLPKGHVGLMIDMSLARVVPSKMFLGIPLGLKHGKEAQIPVLHQ